MVNISAIVFEIGVPGHEADEVTDAESWLEDTAVLESEAPYGIVDSCDDGRRCVVRIERGRARRLILTICQEASEFRTLAFPIAAGMLRKHLRDTAPAHVFYQDALLIIRGRAAFLVESFYQLDRDEVVATLLLERPFAESVLRADVVVVLA